MKIDDAIREAYSMHLPLNRLVQTEIQALQPRLDRGWHFEDRIKTEESFSQKIEAGRGTGGLNVEDFYGCTIVVRSAVELPWVEEIVRESFNVVERRPQTAKSAVGNPSDFRFDDVRLYAKLKVNYSGEMPVHNVLFEIQLKTFLQHAWAIAAHDLTYKTAEVSWAKLRVAHQVRAMLEHAELSIEQFERLAESTIIAKKHDEYDEINRIIDFLKAHWPASALPTDLQRLSRSVLNASKVLSVTLDNVFSEVKSETQRGFGAKTLDLSPFGAIVQSILREHTVDVKMISRRIRNKIAISKRVEIPDYLKLVKDKVFYVY